MASFMGQQVPYDESTLTDLMERTPVRMQPLPNDSAATDGGGEQLLRLLKHTLDWHINEVTPTAIARRYNLPDGATVVVNQKWRTKVQDFVFPIRPFVMAAGRLEGVNADSSPILTELDFRIRCNMAILGRIKDWANVQGNGDWRVKSYEARITTERDDSVKVVGGKVSHSVTLDDDGHADDIMRSMFNKEPAPKDSGRPAGTLSVIKVLMTIVDIAGAEDIEYEGGKPIPIQVKMAREQAKATERGMSLLAETILETRGTPASRKQHQAPSVDEGAIRDQAAKDALAAMADKLGCSIEDLQATLKATMAKKKREEEEDALEYDKPVSGEPGTIVMKGLSPVYICPVPGCSKVLRISATVAVTQHLKAHLEKGQITRDDHDRYVAGFKAAIKDYKKSEK